MFVFVLFSLSFGSAYIALTTPTVSDVTSSSATFHSMVYNDEEYGLNVGFEYKKSTSSSWILISNSFNWIYASGNTVFEYDMTGLDNGVEYDFRSVIIANEVQSLYITPAIYSTFETDSIYEEPEVTTQDAGSIGDTYATFYGQLVDLNDESNTEVSFAYRRNGGSWYWLDSPDVYSPSYSAPLQFWYDITGLVQNSYYEYFAFSLDAMSSYSSQIHSFYTLETSVEETMPVFSTLTHSDLTETSVVLKGTLENANDWVDDDITIMFFYYEDDVATTIISIEDSSEIITSSGVFDYLFTGLTQDTDYHYTFAYSNDGFTTWTLYDGSLGTFTTIADSVSYDWVNTTKENQTSVGTFSRDLTGLSKNTEYSYRACIDSENGIICSDIDTFVTDDRLTPEVVTLNITNITDTSIVLNGYVSNFGDYESVEVSFAVNDDVSNLYIDYLFNATTNSTFSYKLENLNAMTFYNVSAVAYSLGEYYYLGNILNVTTPNPSSYAMKIRSFPDIIMGYNDQININIDDYFSSYDSVLVQYENYSFSSNTITIVENNISVLSLSLSDVLYHNELDLYSYSEDLDYEIIIYVYDDNGYSTWSSFNVSVNNDYVTGLVDTDVVLIDLPNVYLDFNESFVVGMNDYFIDGYNLNYTYTLESIIFNGTTIIIDNLLGLTSGGYMETIDTYVVLSAYLYPTLYAFGLSDENTYSSSYEVEVVVNAVDSTGFNTQQTFIIYVGDLYQDPTAKPFFDGFDAFKDMFPTLDNEYMNSKWVGFFIIITLIGLGFMFIAKPLNYNTFSLVVVALIGLFGTFISSWVGYTPFSWFVTPIVIFTTYIIYKTFMGGGN